MRRQARIDRYRQRKTNEVSRARRNRPAVALWRGDCLERLRHVKTGSIDAVIADPPYGCTDLPWDQAVDWPRLWPELLRALKPTGVVAFFAQQPFTTELINSQRRMFRYELVWQKSRVTGFLDANRRPLRAHESILLFAPRLHASTYNPQKTPGKPYGIKRHSASAHYGKQKQHITTTNATGDRHPRSVLSFACVPLGEVKHPTQKPVDLLRWLVRTYTNPGDLVLDPFAGHATTGVACLAEGRTCLLIERDKNYAAAARRRLRQASRNAA
jgi:DNA modification methylase